MQTLTVFLGSIALCVVIAKFITTPLGIINKLVADAVAIIVAIGLMLYLAYANIFGG
jgi:hypothetical protein